MEVKKFKEGVVSKIEGWEVLMLISPTNTIKKTPTINP